jgi:tryptophanyl-tRNA synthetase
MAKRTLSGVQPSGDLHVGNYLGAIRQHVAQPDNALFFIANYHAQTTVFDADQLSQSTREAAATYLALGLDTNRAMLFRQSDVPQVTELMWLLTVVAGKGLLDRAVSYKDKVAQGIVPSLGLYMYPMLMAADILLYDTEIVPVGSDQVQHVEIARDIARSFNARYGDVFRVPEYEVGTPVPVPGIDGRKMSKSYGNTLPLFASPAELRAKVMAIVTDAAPLAEPKDPDSCTVFQLFSLFATPEERAELAQRYRAGGFGYGHAKLMLLERLAETFTAPRERYLELLRRPDDLEDILTSGATRAKAIAGPVLDRARRASGL